MLARLANKSSTAVVARAMTTGAVRSFSAAAASVAQPRQHRQQQQQREQPSSGSSLRWLGALAATGALALTVASCERVVEQTKGGGVDYAQVRKAIEDALEKEGYDDGSYGPVLVRLAWHSAGTYDRHKRKWGSDGATMRFSPESNHGANAGLKIARDLLEPIKQRFPGCTYADLYTLAGCVAIEQMGGPQINWRPGRSDAKDESSCPPDGSLPDASQGPSHVRDVFAHRMGFSDRETVALIGAHALGRCHTDRSGYSGPWTRAPTTFSNEFYRLLLDEEWTPKKWAGPLQYENSKSGSDLMMLPADLALIKDKKFRQYVEAYAEDEQLFFRDFASAFGKLMELGVPFNKRSQINLVEKGAE